jgi:probable F420-dependent oxidoreductase
MQASEPRTKAPGSAKALETLVRRFKEVSRALDNEGWDQIIEPKPVRTVTPKLAQAAAPAPSPPIGPPPAQQLKFGLHISDFEWIENKEDTSEALGDLAKRAEAVGFESLWVMDHLIQIPQVGREWDSLLEPFTTLAHLAASTERCRLGVLVSPVTTRHVGVLAKLVATLDVLSGGRAVCGVGAGSSPAEHEAYGIPFGPARERLALLEETVQALRIIWGSGSKAFEGDAVSIERAVGYPRPLQDPLPIIVGGSGDRTLGIAARHADGCHVFGDIDTATRRIERVRTLLEAEDRSVDEFEISHLGNLLVARSSHELNELVDARRPPNMGPDRFANRANAGTVDDHAAAFRSLASAGLDTAIVSTSGLGEPDTMIACAELIETVNRDSRWSHGQGPEQEGRQH